MSDCDIIGTVVVVVAIVVVVAAAAVVVCFSYYILSQKIFFFTEIQKAKLQVFEFQENKDLAEFMRSDDIDLLWNLADVDQAIRENIEQPSCDGSGKKDGNDAKKSLIGAASEETRAVAEGDGFYRLRSRAVAKDNR